MEHAGEPYVVSLALPEIEQDEIQIEIRDDRVTIRAMKRERVRQRRLWPWPPRFALSRSFQLPADADRERVEASFDDGKLTLRIPRRGAEIPIAELMEVTV